MITIDYITKAYNSLCADDLKYKYKDKKVDINLDYIVSLSEPIEFYTPFSNKYVASYVLLTMCNNDKYCIREAEYKRIKETLK
jgi:hypothetical protein